MFKCFGQEASAVKNGKLISVESAEESSIFAFSAASLILCIAITSEEISTQESFLNSSRIN
jgi:saccharopine dehydrogenase-like NADP-dependent oxidoreductase